MYLCTYRGQLPRPTTGATLPQDLHRFVENGHATDIVGS